MQSINQVVDQPRESVSIGQVDSGILNKRNSMRKRPAAHLEGRVPSYYSHLQLSVFYLATSARLHAHCTHQL